MWSYFLPSPQRSWRTRWRLDSSSPKEHLVRHTLHLAVVVTDAKTALPGSTKLFVKMKDVSLTVAEELRLDSEPRLSDCVQGFVDDLLQLEGESTKHPSQHDPVVVVPVHSVVDLVGEDVATYSEQHHVVPPRVLGWREDPGRW
jgi:hypothetical protein